MGKQLHNDDFEHFFKNHLENFDGEPSDEMWSRIEPVIPTKPRKSWLSYVLPVALLMSFLSLIFVGNRMFEYKRNSEDLKEKLEQSNRDVQDLNEQLTLQQEVQFGIDSSLQAAVTEEGSVMNNSQRAEAAILNSTNNAPTISQDKATKNKVDKQGFNTINKTSALTAKPSATSVDTVQQLENTDKIIIPSSPVEHIELHHPKRNQQSQKTVPMAMQDDLHFLNTKPSTVHFQSNWELNNAYVIDAPLSKGKSLSSNSITFFVAPSILKNTILPVRPSVGPPPPLNRHPIPTEKVRLGRAIGVKYSHDISDKLSFNIGGIYARSMYGFSTRQLLPYRQDTEVDISGIQAANTIDYDGASTYGEFGIDADITRMKDNGIVQDDEINIKIEATANIHSIAVPVYLSYTMLEVEGLSVGLKAGLGYNNLIRNDLKINNFEIEQQGFEVQNTTLKRRPVPSKKGGISTISGISLAYAFQDNYSLTIEPTWTSAISVNHQADFGRTKSSLFNIDIGLRYAF